MMTTSLRDHDRRHTQPNEKVPNVRSLPVLLYRSQGIAWRKHHDGETKSSRTQTDDPLAGGVA